MAEFHIFTSAALNYVPKVRILALSCREFHPEAKFHLALADEGKETIEFSDNPFDSVIAISELGIPNWRRWAFCHRLVELATAIKPFVLERLLHEPGCRKVFYIDPDIVLYSRLDDLLVDLDDGSVVLTPHLTRPETSLRGILDNEISALQHGTYNLGFLGVRSDNTGKEFARWWAERCYRYCRDDIANGLFTDQRWIDLVPALFPKVRINRSSRHNVATWNIGMRYVTYDNRNGYLVDGEPLGFYHFTGFDSGAHRLMAGIYGAENKAIRKLVRFYTEEMSNSEKSRLSRCQWAFAKYSDGTEIQDSERLVYRERPDLQDAFPDPFNADGYLQWYRENQRNVCADSVRTGMTAPVRKMISGRKKSRGLAANGLRNGFVSVYLCLRQFFFDPRLIVELLVRGMELRRREGWRGLLDRLRKRIFIRQ